MGKCIIDHYADILKIIVMKNAEKFQFSNVAVVIICKNVATKIITNKKRNATASKKQEQDVVE